MCGTAILSRLAALAYFAAFSAALAAQVPPEMHVQGRGQACSLDFSRDGRILAAGGTMNKIRLYDLRTGMEIRVLRHVPADSGIGETESGSLGAFTRMGTVGAVRFSPAGKRLLVGCENGSIQIWDPAAASLAAEMRGHADRVNCLAVTDDGRRAFTGSDDLDVIEWDLEKMTVARVYEGHEAPVRSLDLSRDGRLLVSGGYDGTVRLWSASADRPIRTMRGHAAGVCGVAFSPDGGRIASCSTDLVAGNGADIREPDGVYVRVWDLASGAPVARFATPLDPIKRRAQYARGIAWTEDGSRLVVMCESEIVLMDASSGAVSARYPLKGEERYHDAIRLAPDDGLLAYGGRDSSPALLALPSLDGRRLLGGVAPVLNSCSLSRDGNRVLYENGRASLWDAGSLRRIELKVDGKPRTATTISLSPRGDAFFTADSNLMAIWRIGTDGSAAIAHRFANRGYRISAAWSPDGSRLVLGMETKVGAGSSGGSYATTRLTLYDALSGRALSSQDLEKDSKVICLEFSPDGRALFAGTREGKVMRYSVPEWKRAWTADTGFVMRAEGPFMRTGIAQSFDPKRLSASPDGSLLAAIGGSNRILLLEAASGATRPFPAPDDGSYLDAVFSADGSAVVASTVEGRIDFLDPATGAVQRSLDYGAAPVFSLSVSADGKRILSGQADGTMRLWDLATGGWTTFMDDAATGRWIAYTDDGYWDASRLGGSLVAVVSGLSCWSVDQFAARSNRPDLILSRWGSADSELVEHYRAQYLKRLRRLGLSEASLRELPAVPEARIEEALADGRAARLSLSFSDPSFDLVSYNVYADGVPLFGPYGKALSGRRTAVAEAVALAPGANLIEVGCLNANGAESFREGITAEGLPSGKPDLYFLGFGVSRYRDSRIDLQYADKDVRDLAALLEEAGRGTYGAVRARVYLNEEVTAEAIGSAGSLLEGAKPGDSLVLFISGHGVHDADPAATYYYLTHDTELGNLRGTAADYELVEGLLHGAAPRRKLFLMDTCESGEIDPATTARYEATAGSKGIRPRTTKTLVGKGLGVTSSGPLPERRWYLLDQDRYIYNDLLRRSGAIVFSSCKGGEFSYESDEVANGFFTEAVMDALRTRKSDIDGDGTLRMDELKAFVGAAVAAMTSGLQHPTVDRDNIHQSFGLPLLAGP